MILDSRARQASPEIRGRPEIPGIGAGEEKMGMKAGRDRRGTRGEREIRDEQGIKGGQARLAIRDDEASPHRVQRGSITLQTATQEE